MLDNSDFASSLDFIGQELRDLIKMPRSWGENPVVRGLAWQDVNLSPCNFIDP